MVTLNSEGLLSLTTDHTFTDNVDKVLKPDKLFGKDLAKEVKPGDSIEICPAASTLT
jgi:hypothetical protein